MYGTKKEGSELTTKCSQLKIFKMEHLEENSSLTQIGEYSFAECKALHDIIRVLTL